MTGSGGEGLHIPEEWSRENTKATTKTVANRNTKQPRGGKPGPATMAIDGNESHNVEDSTQTTAKKRKRIIAADTNAVVGIDSTEATNDIRKQEVIDTAIPTSSQASTMMTGLTHSSSHRHCEETESVMRGLYHQVEKLSRRSGCALQDGIYLDSIMTHVPYADVLQQMFGGNAVTDSACVPVVARAYEESYMREALSGVEGACVMGSNCECQFIDEHNPFTGVQFTLPVEAFSTEMLQMGVTEELSSNKLCVLCCRKNTQSLFYEALYNHRAYSGCIQLYGNICDRPGEYATEAMLICPLSGPINNMPIPVVAHQRNRYSVVVHNGVRQLRQHRVGYEDFHVPSSSRC